MRLILFDRLNPERFHFYPLAFSRPIWELRCGMSSLGEKLIARVGADSVAGFVPPYMAEACRERCGFPLNEPSALQGDDLVLIDARVKAAGVSVERAGASRLVLNERGECLLARINQSDLEKLPTDSLEALLRVRRQRAARVARSSPDLELHLGLDPGQPRTADAGLRGGRPPRHRGKGRGTDGDSGQSPGRLHRTRCARAPHGRHRRRTRTRLYRRRSRRPSLLPYRGTLLSSARSRCCWVPSAAKGIRSGPSAGSVAKSRNRSSRATATSTTTGSSATPMWGSG